MGNLIENSILRRAVKLELKVKTVTFPSREASGGRCHRRHRLAAYDTQELTAEVSF
jgi:hypothetical protein